MLALNRIFGNLSVGVKLSLGFGLVLLVTLGVAITAFSSLSVLQQRGQQSRQESSIQALIIRCEWYDWAVVDPLDHAGFFSALLEDRNTQIAAGSWSEQEEKNYQSRTPDSYRGWWKLENLPHGLNESDWFGWGYDPGIVDSDLPAETVAVLMQEKTFDVWRIETYEEIEYLTADEVDGVIAYWKRERSLGDDYY